MQEPRPGAVTEALERVYARPEFAERALYGPFQLLSDAWSAAWAWIRGLLPSGLALSPDAPLVRIAVLVLFAAMVFLVARLLIRAGLAQMGAAGEEGIDRKGRRAPAGPTDAAGWEALAGEAARAGRFREAALALYRAVILRLDQSGAVRFHEGKTPGDYRREAADRPELSAHLDGFLRILLPLAFGARPPDEPAFLRLQEAAAGVGWGAQHPSASPGSETESSERERHDATTP